jgi:iron complex outermembrane receptor protein
MQRKLWQPPSLVAVSSLIVLSCAAVSSRAAAAEEQGDEPANLDEIVVTALRKTETAQKSPAAITVVTGNVLQQQQVFDIRGVQNLVPSARFTANNSSIRVFIRGIGSSLDFYWIPETTAINLNGVYVPRFATTGAFFDVESVQVLPGPQGVLYGKSAGGGAVVINTNRPVDRPEASGLFEYGNYNTIHAEGMGNVPLTDSLAVRGAFAVNKHNGYQSFGLDASDSYAVRLSALWKPIDGLSVLLWGTHFDQTGKPTAAQYLPYPAGHDPWYVPANDPVTGADNTRGSRQDVKYTIGGTNVTYTLGDVTVDYNAAILRQTETALHKLVGNDQVIDNAQTQYTQNLHLNGTVGALEWIAGVDWFYATSRYNTLFGPRKFGTIFPAIDNRSLSGFAQATYSLESSLRLVAGSRYTHDSLYLNGYSNACFAVCFQSPISFDKDWSHVDLKGGVEADLTSKVLMYANVQTGYAPGTLNTYTNKTGLNKEIKPQTLLAYTAGLKSTLSDGKVILNVEGFHYRYDKLIIQAINASIGQQSLYNAPHATVYGAQLTSAFQPTANDTISVNLAYTHSAYDAFVPSPGLRDLHGLQLTFTPTWNAVLSYDRRFDLPRGGSLDARVSSYLSSSFWGTFDHSADAYQGGYSRTDASLTYHSSSDAWSVGAWVKNVGNKAVNSAMSSSGYPAPFAGATGVEPPRTYGVSFGFRL